ncbi:MAG: M48 family metallopeptidase [Candidatus Berkiellales bacterium]
MPCIKTDHTVVNFRLRRSKRAKRLQIVTRHEDFEVVAPIGISNREILKFAWQQRHWMSKILLRKKPQDEIKYFWPDRFVDGETVPFRGVRLQLQVKYDSTPLVIHENNILTVILSWHILTSTQIENAVKQALIKWYQQQAKAAITASLAHFCPLLKRWPQSAHLKQQKTRWGSCSSKQKIYINWLLILAPEGVLEYVVLHELCHLFHRNHSQRFWNKVEQFLPNYEKYETWLRKHGLILQGLAWRND